MTILLFINLCLAFCGLVESTEEVDHSQQTLPSPQNVGTGSNEYSLNLSNVDSSVFHTTEELNGDVRTVTHRVKSGHKVTSVVDNGCSLWKAEPGENLSEVWIHTLTSSSICRVEYLDKDGIIWTKYLEKSTPGGGNGPSWTSIEGCAYIQRHKEMHTSKEIKMEITRTDPYMCECNCYVEGKIVYTIGYPFDGYKVTKLTFGGTLIWEYKDKYCSGFRVTKEGASFKFVISTCKDKNVSKTTVTKKEAELIPTGTTCTFPGACSPKEPLKTRINIMGPINPIQYTVYGYRFGKTSVYTFTPKPTIWAKFVFKHHMKIWGTENGNDRCLRALYVPYHNGSSFLDVYAIVCGRMEHKYFQATGQNGSYNEITREVYIARLGLQNGSDQREDDAQDDTNAVQTVCSIGNI